jgi:CARDB
MKEMNNFRSRPERQRLATTAVVASWLTAVGTVVGCQPAMATDPLDDAANYEVVSMQSMKQQGKIDAQGAYDPQLNVPATVIPPTAGASDVYYQFDTPSGTAGAGAPDTQVAVSRTHVCATKRNSIACYTKAGNAVSLGNGTVFGENPAADFFTSSGITVPLVNNSADNLIKDCRVVARPDHFFIVCQGRALPAELFIAVSKSADPRDGWWTYSDDPVTGKLNGQDYAWIGLSDSHLLYTNYMGACGESPNWTCAGPTDTRQFMYPIGDLVLGKPYARLGWKADAADGRITAVISEDNLPFDPAKPASSYWVHREKGKAIVYGWKPGDAKIKVVTLNVDTLEEPPDNGDAVASLGGPVKLRHDIWEPINAVQRGDRLVWSSQGGIGARHVEQMLEYDLSQFWNGNITGPTRQAILGSGHEAWDYGISSVAMTADGGIVVNYIGVNAQAKSKLLAAVWSDATTANPVLEVFAESVDYPGLDFDMSGAYADPVDGKSVYIAQIYRSAAGNKVRISRLLGTTAPDLMPMLLQTTSPPAVTAGVDRKVSVFISNQGDAPAAASKGKLLVGKGPFLNTASDVAKFNGQDAVFDIPQLGPGASAKVDVDWTPGTAGDYVMGAQVDTTNSVAELYEANNSNPSYYDTNCGNVPVTINP